MKLVINQRKKNGKNTNAWKLNNMLQKKKPPKTYGSMKKSERQETASRQKKIKTTFQNLWDAVKAVLREKLIAIYTGPPQETKKL